MPDLGSWEVRGLGVWGENKLGMLLMKKTYMASASLSLLKKSSLEMGLATFFKEFQTFSFSTGVLALEKGLSELCFWVFTCFDFIFIQIYKNDAKAIYHKIKFLYQIQLQPLLAKSLFCCHQIFRRLGGFSWKHCNHMPGEKFVFLGILLIPKVSNSDFYKQK